MAVEPAIVMVLMTIVFSIFMVCKRGTVFGRRRRLLFHFRIVLQPFLLGGGIFRLADCRKGGTCNQRC